MNQDNRDFSAFTVDQLLDFLHGNRVYIMINRSGAKIGDPYYVQLEFKGTGLNNNEIEVRLTASGQSLQTVLHGLIKDYLRLK